MSFPVGSCVLHFNPEVGAATLVEYRFGDASVSMVLRGPSRVPTYVETEYLHTSPLPLLRELGIRHPKQIKWGTAFLLGLTEFSLSHPMSDDDLLKALEVDTSIYSGRFSREPPPERARPERIEKRRPVSPGIWAAVKEEFEKHRKWKVTKPSHDLLFVGSWLIVHKQVCLVNAILDDGRVHVIYENSTENFPLAESFIRAMYRGGKVYEEDL